MDRSVATALAKPTEWIHVSVTEMSRHVIVVPYEVAQPYDMFLVQLARCSLDHPLPARVANSSALPRIFGFLSRQALQACPDVRSPLWCRPRVFQQQSLKYCASSVKAKNEGK